MFTDEIRGTVLMAVALMVLSVLLGFVSFLFGLSGDLASARNNQVYAEKAVSSYMEFNKFNESPQYGVDVIAAIRDYYNTGVEVVVKNTDGTVMYEVDKSKSQLNPSLVSMNYLSTLFQPSDQFNAVLVYNQVDPTTITSSYTQPASNFGYHVYAIVFFKQ